MTRAAISSIFVAGLACASLGQIRSIPVVTTKSMAPSLRAIAREFERTKPGVNILITVQPDTRELSGGAILVGPMETVGLRSLRVFAKDPMVAVVSADEQKITKFAHLASSLSVTWPLESTLVGRHADAILRRGGDSYGKEWLANIQRNKKPALLSGQDVVNAVATGKVDAGITNLSQTTAQKSKLGIIFLPAELTNSVDYVAAVRPGTPGQALSKAFVEYLFSAGNQLRLEAAGFISPLRPPPDLTVVKPSGMLRLYMSALSTHPQESIYALDATGRERQYMGVSLAQILKDEKEGTVLFTSADGLVNEVDLRTIRNVGAVLLKMSDGNYQVVLGKKPPSQWVRWIRRIELR